MCVYVCICGWMDVIGCGYVGVYEGTFVLFFVFSVFPPFFLSFSLLSPLLSFF